MDANVLNVYEVVRVGTGVMILAIVVIVLADWTQITCM